MTNSVKNSEDNFWWALVLFALESYESDLKSKFSSSGVKLFDTHLGKEIKQLKKDRNAVHLWAALTAMNLVGVLFSSTRFLFLIGFVGTSFCGYRSFQRFDESREAFKKKVYSSTKQWTKSGLKTLVNEILGHPRK